MPTALLMGSPSRVAGMCLQVQAPAMNIPTDEQFFSKTEKGKPDIAYLKNHFYREGRVKEEHALYVIEKATEILHTEPNLLHVDAPVTGVYSILCPHDHFACLLHEIFRQADQSFLL
jgi:hypothetical protein